MLSRPSITSLLSPSHSLTASLVDVGVPRSPPLTLSLPCLSGSLCYSSHCISAESSKPAQSSCRLPFFLLPLLPVAHFPVAVSSRCPVYRCRYYLPKYVAVFTVAVISGIPTSLPRYFVHHCFSLLLWDAGLNQSVFLSIQHYTAIQMQKVLVLHSAVNWLVQMEEKLSMVRRDDYKKMTREMMDVLFTQEELMTSSVTGRKGGTSANTKPALDINKTALIVCKFICQVVLR